MHSREESAGADTVVASNPLTEVDLMDEADEFEDELAAEMLRTGAIEVWG